MGSLDIEWQLLK